MVRPYPRFYAVNDRPVKIVLLPNGGSDCLVLDFATCRFVPDRSYFSRVSDTGIGKDVDQLTEAEFERLVDWHRAELARRLFKTPAEWSYSLESDDVMPTYRALINATIYNLRLNPPGEASYTLLTHGEKVADVTQWPAVWLHPGPAKPPPSDLGPSISPNVLRKWSEELCRLSWGSPEETAMALGITGAIIREGDDAAIEPPPEGTSGIRLVKHPAGFEYIEVQVSGTTLTHAQLDAHFGQSNQLPQMHPFSAYKVAYRVEVLGAPYICAVVASFEDTPTAAAPAKEVLLRRDRASS